MNEIARASMEHVPDVLATISQLPNDDVYTPPKVVGAMLDILPAEVWSEPDFRWLDPATKSGIYLREAFRRLMVGLAEWEPDGQQRRDHILRHMLFGAATTQINGEIARRTLYLTKDATGADVRDGALASRVVRFTTSDGNIPFVETHHSLDRKGERCLLCKAPAKLIRDSREEFAFSFIHGTYPTKELANMKFDVIVGNPPYQIGTDGHGATASTIYHQFVERAVELDPRYVLMITPSRWFTGGKGLNDFRDTMISDRRMRVLVDNPKVFDCFPSVEIQGGVSFFLWDREWNGDCEVSTRIDGEIVSTTKRDLRSGKGVLVRDNRAVSIIRKAEQVSADRIASHSSVTKPFGLTMRSNYAGSSPTPFEGSIPLLYANRVGYSRRDQIQRNHEWIDRFKVLLPMAYNGGQQVESGIVRQTVIGEPIAVAPGSACVQTYFIPGMFDTAEEAANFAHYLATKFVRFLILQRKSTQHITPDRFLFVPWLDMTRVWTDPELYALAKLSEDEVAYVEASIKPRSINLSLDSPIPASHLPGGRKYRATDTPAEYDEDEGDDE